MAKLTRQKIEQLTECRFCHGSGEVPSAAFDAPPEGCACQGERQPRLLIDTADVLELIDERDALLEVLWVIKQREMNND